MFEQFSYMRQSNSTFHVCPSLVYFRS